MVKKSSTWQKSSSKSMMSSLAWLSDDFRLLEDTCLSRTHVTNLRIRGNTLICSSI
jgi:hypothetical protein